MSNPLNWGLPLATKSGQPARLLRTSHRATLYPRVVSIEIAGITKLAHYTEDGRFVASGRRSELDLINAPEPDDNPARRAADFAAAAAVFPRATTSFLNPDESPYDPKGQSI